MTVPKDELARGAALAQLAREAHLAPCLQRLVAHVAGRLGFVGDDERYPWFVFEERGTWRRTSVVGVRSFLWNAPSCDTYDEVRFVLGQLAWDLPFVESKEAHAVAALLHLGPLIERGDYEMLVDVSRRGVSSPARLVPRALVEGFTIAARRRGGHVAKVRPDGTRAPVLQLVSGGAL